MQTVAIANNCNSVPLSSSLPFATANTYYQEQSSANVRDERIWILKDFFVLRFCLAFSINTFSSLLSDTTTHDAFFYLPQPLARQHQFKQEREREKKRESEEVQYMSRKNFSPLMLAIASSPHTLCRYSGICLLGNVVSGKTYRQLTERTKKRRRRQKD